MRQEDRDGMRDFRNWRGVELRRGMRQRGMLYHKE